MPVQPNATVDTVREFWQSHINNEYYTDQERATEAYFAEIENRRYRYHYHLVDLFKSLQGSTGRLLEVGCGIGVDSMQLAKCGFDVTAVDLTENALTIAKEFASHRDVTVNFQLGNAEGLQFPDNSFDVVYSFGVLHHTPDIEHAVSEVHRVLKPGGSALVMLYAKWSLVNLVHRVFRLPYESPRDRKDHCPVVYTFSKREVRKLFRQFKSVSVQADYPFTFGFGPLGTRTPLALRRLLGRLFGWHLMITATK